MSKSLRVLLVEDKDDCLLVIETLRSGGYEVEFERVETAQAMQAALARRGWDIVLSDYCMPAFDARGALRVLQESGRDLPFIIVSGTVGEDVAVEALKLGADDYLLKQSLARLAPAIERALNDAENRRQRKNQEEILRRNAQIFSQLQDSVICTDRDARITYWNAAANRLYGWTSDEMLGRPITDLFPPENRSATNKRVLSLMTEGHGFNAELEEQRKDGTRIWVQVRVTPLRDGAGNPIGYVGVGRDITSRRKVEEEMRQNAETMAAAQRIAHFGSWELELSNPVIDANPLRWSDECYRVFGFAPHSVEVTNDLFFSLVHPEDHDTVHRAVVEALENRTEYSIVHRAVLPEGTIRFIHEQAKVFVDQSTGHPTKMVGTAYDITESQQDKTRLEEALAREKELSREAKAGERAKSEFLAVMSHEIRTPMNGILGFAEILATTPSLPEDCRDYAQTIVSSGEALLRILDDILEFSRLEAGRMSIEKSPFSPQEMLNAIYTLLKPRAQEGNLEFNLQIADDVPDRVVGDAGRLRQVLLNLVGNAIKFTEQGSVLLSVHLGERGGGDRSCELRFVVRDTGPGISPDKFESIFEPFIQADSTMSRRYGGTGLGLSISRRLAELMGGHLTVDNGAGGGAEFTVTVPAQIPEELLPEMEPVRAERLDESFASLHPLRILVVDDDRVNLKFIETAVRKLGYQPLSARHGREAVAVFAEQHPDCILMDVQMPEMDGVEATERIRALESSQGGYPVFIAALTANIFPANQQRCIEAGMDEYLNKPIKLPSLAKALAKASERSRQNVSILPT